MINTFHADVFLHSTDEIRKPYRRMKKSQQYAACAAFIAMVLEDWMAGWPG